MLAWAAPLLAAALVVVAVWLANARDRGRAERAAAAELNARLEPGERALRQVPVAQRHWYDLYRATWGILAATDRRVMFVGVLPELYPTTDAPRAFDVRSFPYDTIFSIANVAAPPCAAAVRVSHGTRTQRYETSLHYRRPVRALVELAAGRDRALRERLRRERAYHDSLAALPPIREYYTVQRGDALESIARRYETTTDSLRALNGLPDDRIRIGQQLLVRVTPHPITPCPPSICGDVTSSGGEIQPTPARTPSPPPR